MAPKSQASTGSKVDQLNRARGDLDRAVLAREKILTRETKARGSAADYATWRLEQGDNELEIERLTGLTAALEPEAENEIREEDAAAALKQRPVKIRENAALAVHTCDVLKQIIDLALPLLERHARSDAEDAEINARLPEDIAPIISANTIARSLPALPFEEISREPMSVWVKTGTDFVIEDQDLVEEILDKHTKEPTRKGRYLAGSRFPCERKMVDKLSFYSEVPGQRPGLLWDLRIPLPDRPYVIDFSGCRNAQDVLVKLGSVDKLRRASVKREVEVKHVAQKR